MEGVSGTGMRCSAKICAHPRGRSQQIEPNGLMGTGIGASQVTALSAPRTTAVADQHRNPEVMLTLQARP